jgi:hypothetical protein
MVGPKRTSPHALELCATLQLPTNVLLGPVLQGIKPIKSRFHFRRSGINLLEVCNLTQTTSSCPSEEGREERFTNALAQFRRAV